MEEATYIRWAETKRKTGRERHTERDRQTWMKRELYTETDRQTGKHTQADTRTRMQVQTILNQENKWLHVPRREPRVPPLIRSERT